MNQPSPICVLYLSDASNNEENERMKRENSDDHTHFFCSTNFFLPSQRQKSIIAATITFFYQQRLSNCLYTKDEFFFYLVKGEYDTCQLILTKQVLKLFDCHHITVRYHNQRNTALTLHPS